MQNQEAGKDLLKTKVTIYHRPQSQEGTGRMRLGGYNDLVFKTGATQPHKKINFDIVDIYHMQYYLNNRIYSG